MTLPVPSQVTRLLGDWSSGDQRALEKLIPLVQPELHRLAHHYMSREAIGHTLQTTALIHEAYLRLIDQREVNWQSRAHFFAISAQAMRRILVDYARTKHREKRGGDAFKVPLEEAALMDGAGYFKIFYRISLPQLRPALSALGIITFTQTWNYYFQARVLLEPHDAMTLPIAMDLLRGYMASGNLSVVMAAMSMAVLPVILIFLLAQKLVIEGVTMSGIKS